MNATDTLLIQIRIAELPTPVTEYRFLDTRQFRFDVAWPTYRIALEIEGGHAIGGRHVRPDGFRRDCEKYAEAVVRGWSVLRVIPDQVQSGAALAWLVRLFAWTASVRTHPECLYRTLGDRAPCLLLGAQSSTLVVGNSGSTSKGSGN